MQPEIAQATMQFMQRVQINPQEIQAWQQCMQALSEVANPPQQVGKVSPIEDKANP